MTNAMVYLLMGDRVNACKCIIQAALTGAALPIAGIAIGGLCNLNTTTKLVTAFTLIGAGAYTVGTSFVDFCSYYEKLSAEIAKGENANGADIFYYISGLIQSGAGMVYGGLSIAGGASGLMNQCYVEGTEVATDNGLKNIEDIEEGDVVWSCNPDTGETGLKSVKQVFVNETDELVHVTITNDSGVSETIDTTVMHPFYVVDYGIYKNTNEKSPIKYIINETKYNTSKQSTLSDGVTKQMSDSWITGKTSGLSNRIKDAVSDKDLAEDIMQALESGQVERVLSVVDTEGKVTNYKLNKLGEITGPWPE